MGNTLGRGGRRRRVLNEEIVAASATHAAYRTGSVSSPAEMKTARYGEAATVKHHARISDFVARRSGTIWAGWAVGIVCVAGMVALDGYRERIAAVAGAASVAPLELSAPGSLANWFSSVIVLLAAAHAMYIYSIRRHKLNDYRGRYRIWFWAAGALAALSVNVATGLHTVAAAAAAHLCGWTALPNHAVWWLLPAGVVFGWIGYFTLRDVWESRLARLAYLVTLLLFAAGLTALLFDLARLGITPEVASRVSPVAVSLGNVLLLTTLAAYARFVSLDAEGLILVPGIAQEKVTQMRTPDRAREKAVVTKTDTTTKSSSTLESTAKSQTTVKTLSLSDVRKSSRRAAEAKSEWVDGRTPVKEDFYSDDESESDRKLSKAERKRLRKLKTQHRRAA